MEKVLTYPQIENRPEHRLCETINDSTLGLLKPAFGPPDSYTWLPGNRAKAYSVGGVRVVVFGEEVIPKAPLARVLAKPLDLGGTPTDEALEYIKLKGLTHEITQGIRKVKEYVGDRPISIYLEWSGGAHEIFVEIKAETSEMIELLALIETFEKEFWFSRSRSLSVPVTFTLGK